MRLLDITISTFNTCNRPFNGQISEFSLIYGREFYISLAVTLFFNSSYFLKDYVAHKLPDSSE